jgi:hypothetical protein
MLSVIFGMLLLSRYKQILSNSSRSSRGVLEINCLCDSGVFFLYGAQAHLGFLHAVLQFGYGVHDAQGGSHCGKLQSADDGFVDHVARIHLLARVKNRIGAVAEHFGFVLVQSFNQGFMSIAHFGQRLTKQSRISQSGIRAPRRDRESWYGWHRRATSRWNSPTDQLEPRSGC